MRRCWVDNIIFTFQISALWWQVLFAIDIETISQFVLKNAHRLKGSQFGINEQFPAEIVARRQKLYPKMREAK
jgi:hypothetical protein